MRWLVYGGNGWIGSYIIESIKKIDQNYTIMYGQTRVDNTIELDKEIQNVHPDRIISAIGRTSGPGFNTIDYLEQKGKVVENVRDNLFCPLNLAFISKKYNIHLTYIGTGCIFNGYKNGTGYLETDEPDFFGSSYSVVKGFTDRLVKNFDNVLNVRIRMPIMDDINNKNFIIKLLNYKKICNIPNSMTVLPELIPIMLDMAINNVTGTINLVNPGLISHNEILDMVKQYKIPNLVWENFSIDEQRMILAADRSNNLLDTAKLESLYKVKNIKESVEEIIKKLDI